MVWRVIMARSRACVGVLVMAGGVCVWMYTISQGLFRVVGGVGVMAYICIYV